MEKTEETQCPFHCRRVCRKRKRWIFLVIMAVAIISVLIVGIVMTANYYISYYSAGRVGLPRKGQNNTTPGTTRNGTRAVTTERRSATAPVCDPENRCDSFGIVAICCPYGSSCFPTSLSVSGVFCCADSDHDEDCIYGPVSPVVCLNGFFQCEKSKGGGCCPSGTTCADNGMGCIAEDWTTDPTFDGGTATANIPKATYTELKLGEVAQGPRTSSSSSRGFSGQCIFEDVVLGAAIILVGVIAVLL